MQKIDRHDYIIHQVNLHNKVLLNDLSEQLHVSNDTIRRDLQELSDLGRVIKVHGGAVSLSFHGGGHQSGNDVYAYTQKKIIARKAISLIRDGMFVLTGGGTTVIEMARALPNDLSATFISGSLPALLEYSNHPLIDVIAIGDKVSKTSRITVGSEAIARIKELKVDICFMGINAINVEEGVSDNDWDIVQVKKAMIEASRKLVCLTISEKINSRQVIPICPLNKVDTLITELSPDDPLLRPYVRAGVRVL
ncbi:MAG: DeoR/GlpR transcriptional regulator [Chitinophagaceae bacterium]|nr:DeoR/GlpR transcriptional regulator [Chitinophagaceae bacterium]MCW5914209.1 DeoR/GlpR transcriptional regulator [Chitinophagaceae bacterium]MCZ2395131.1 DeoR/GlpR family DNA-binding transcription regulator [Chitinophagales bacterium]